MLIKNVCIQNMICYEVGIWRQKRVVKSLKVDQMYNFRFDYPNFRYFICMKSQGMPKVIFLKIFHSVYNVFRVILLPYKISLKYPGPIRWDG